MGRTFTPALDLLMKTLWRLASRSIPDALQALDRRGRWLLAAAVFFLFGTMGPLIVLMEPQSIPAPWAHTLFLTVLSGAFASLIILTYPRPPLLVLVVAGFFLTSFNLESIELKLLGVPERPHIDIVSDPESAEAHRLAVGNRQGLGAMAVFLLAAGYTLFVVSVSRETRRRAAVEAEIQLARSVHEALVPRQGVRTDWCMADGWTIPAAKIGGDVFEFVQPTPDLLVVFVADASGHGVGAGLVAAMTKGLLVHDIARSLSPADLLTSVNATLFRLTERNVFVTAAAAIVDRRRGEVEVSTAGHPAVLHRRSDGTTESLRTPSVPLGASPSTIYRVERRTWKAEDRLAFYSDGLTEARDSGGIEFGSERLADLLMAADPLNAVRDALDQHIGSGQRADDVTFVLVSAPAV